MRCERGIKNVAKVFGLRKWEDRVGINSDKKGCWWSKSGGKDREFSFDICEMSTGHPIGLLDIEFQSSQKG